MRAAAVRSVLARVPVRGCAHRGRNIPLFIHPSTDPFLHPTRSYCSGLLNPLPRANVGLSRLCQSATANEVSPDLPRLLSHLQKYQTDENKVHYNILVAILRKNVLVPLRIIHFRHLLHHFTDRGDMNTAEKFLKDVLSCNVLIDTATINCMIAGYSRINQVKRAEKWFFKLSTLPESEKKPQERQKCLCALLDMYRFQQLKDKALHLVGDIRAQEPCLTSATHQAIIRAHLSFGEVTRAQEQIKEMEQEGYLVPTEIHLDMGQLLADEQLFDAATDLLTALRTPEESAFLSSYIAYRQGRKSVYRRTKKTFLEELPTLLESEEGQVSADLLSRWVDLIAKSGNVSQVATIFNAVKRTPYFTVPVAENLMRAYAALGAYDRSILVLDAVLAKGNIQATSGTYNTLISVLVRYKQLGKAEKIFSRMTEDPRVQVTNSTFNIFLAYYANIPEIEKMEKLLNLMNRLKVPQTVRSFSSVLQAFSLVGDLKRMEAIGLMMEEREMPFNKQIYESFLVAHARLGQTDKVEATLHRMSQSSFPPTNSTFRVLISAYYQAEQYEALFQLFERLQQTPNFSFTAADLQIFSDAYQSSESKDFPEMQRYLASLERERLS